MRDGIRSALENRKHSSLDKFRNRFKGKSGQPYILYTKDICTHKRKCDSFTDLYGNVFVTQQSERFSVKETEDENGKFKIKEIDTGSSG